MSKLSPRVVAVINSFHRPALLRRLLASLDSLPELGGGVVVVSADDAATAAVTREFSIVHRTLVPPKNLGGGASIAEGMRVALEDAAATHFLLLDDDTELLPDTLSQLLSAMGNFGASEAVPLVVDPAGHVRWFPGLVDRRKFQIIQRSGLTPPEFIRECGAEPVEFTWTPWPILLVARSAVDRLGVPRSDFCFMGEDLEYTLRLSWRAPALLVPAAVGRHLPPGSKRGPEAYYIDCLHLQNLSYIAWWLPHGARVRRHLPGAIWRFLRGENFGARRVRDLLRALWQGGVRGRPGGDPRADGFWRGYQKARMPA
jgi:GT2 family glycosyltransferase